jgi:hypothetical protein
MLHSIADTISQRLAEPMRKLRDLNVRMTGTKIDLLRITLGNPTVLGDREETYTNSVIENCIVKHPFAADVQMMYTWNGGMQQADNSAINLWDVLPIEVFVPFAGDPNAVPVELKKGDILVEVLFDHNGNKIPFVLEVTKPMGKFFVTRQVSQKAECCLYRGSPADDVKTMIDSYILQIGTPANI